MGPWKEPDTTQALDAMVEKLTRGTAAAVDRHTPYLRPSPYSKRWFSADLKSQQMAVNQARQNWQENCAKLGRDDPLSMFFFEDMRQKRREWARTIEKAKNSHWKTFLNEAGEVNLWKAYMKPRDSWDCTPALKVGNREVADNKEKAQAFMDSFFPPMALAEDETLKNAPSELSWEPISEVEIYRSLKAAKSPTAPGEDGLPTLVWK